MLLFATACLLAAGFGLFFVGLRLMAQTFQIWAGSQANLLLARYTSRPVVAMASGLFVAAILQSSSATNIIVVGLVGAGIISLPAAFAVILGSNVGTTVTAHLVTLPLSTIAPYLLFGGAALGWMHPRRFRFALLARIVASLGGVFYGLSVISVAFKPFVTSFVVQQGLEQLGTSPPFAILIGAVLTGTVQSSSVVTALVVGMARDGLLPTGGAIAMALGSNVGTVATTLLASFWINNAARRAALADLFFNALGVLLVFPLFSVFVTLVAMTASDPGHQVANAHTLFNVLTALAAFPFIPAFCRFIERITHFADS